MTIRHLRIFLSVYQNMSITEASRKLHLAQPSVSLAIKELEETYRIRLFDRINRRLSVTEKGIQFYHYAVHIIDLFDEMEHAMVSPEKPGHIKLGSSITIGNSLLPNVLEQFRGKYPDCEVEVTIRNSNQIIQAVVKNELDLGVVEDKVSNEQLEEEPFMEDRLYFVCSKNHPLAGKKDLTLEDICKFPFYLREPGSASRDITDSLLKSCQLNPRITWESVSNHALLHAIEKNPGITVLSGKLTEEAIAKGYIVQLPLYPEAFLRSFSIIYHKKKYQSDALKCFIELLKTKTEPGM